MRAEGGWDNEVHENIRLKTGTAGKLRSPLVHDSQHRLDRWLAKHNEYSTWEAARRLRQDTKRGAGLRGLLSQDLTIRRQARKSLFLKLPLRPHLMFVYLFLLQMGFLDGLEGYCFCKLMAQHEFNIGLKMRELRQSREDCS